MSSSLLSSILNGNFASAADRHLLHDDDDHFHHPTSRASAHNKGKAPVSTGGGTSIPAVDILDTPKDYIFYVDVPGLSKSDIQVTLEDDNTLVIKSNSGKRKREDDDDNHGKEEKEECKYIRLERRASHKFMRKFRLPEDSNLSAISAKCEDGVLTVTVEKLPPPPKPKTVQVTIS